MRVHINYFFDCVNSHYHLGFNTRNELNLRALLSQFDLNHISIRRKVKEYIVYDPNLQLLTKAE